MESTFSGVHIFGAPRTLVYVSTKVCQLPSAIWSCSKSMSSLLAPLASVSHAGYMLSTHKNKHTLVFLSFSCSHSHQIAVWSPLLETEHIWTLVRRQMKAGAVSRGPFIWFMQLGVHPHHQHWSLQSSVVLFCVNPLRPPWPLGDLTPTLRHIELEIITPIWEKNTSAPWAYQALFFLTAKKRRVYWKQFSQLIAILIEVLYLIKVKSIETVSQRHFSWPTISPTLEAGLFPLSPRLLKAENGDMGFV